MLYSYVQGIKYEYWDCRNIEILFGKILWKLALEICMELLELLFHQKETL